MHRMKLFLLVSFFQEHSKLGMLHLVLTSKQWDQLWDGGPIMGRWTNYGTVLFLYTKSAILLFSAGQGFGPRFLGPKPNVLPLDDPATYYNYKPKCCTNQIIFATICVL